MPRDFRRLTTRDRRGSSQERSTRWCVWRGYGEGTPEEATENTTEPQNDSKALAILGSQLTATGRSDSGVGTERGESLEEDG